MVSKEAILWLHTDDLNTPISGDKCLKNFHGHSFEHTPTVFLGETCSDCYTFIFSKETDVQNLFASQFAVDFEGTMKQILRCVIPVVLVH